jgi:hypothetical protein
VEKYDFFFTSSVKKLAKLSSKRLPVSTFKDAVHLSPNDDYYLVTDSEGNIGNMRFFRPIPEKATYFV